MDKLTIKIIIRRSQIPRTHPKLLAAGKPGLYHLERSGIGATLRIDLPNNSAKN